ncbi:uncharacterized protein PRCAT00005016001 [Priceomyces carsonii]|uniref:uncharacterized protein n=1 Tax=Priceomyces carsonii TaxID=28549 RepID=UPI002ED9E19D|nr:unnamed protein product [Priceomyces carsonii]
MTVVLVSGGSGFVGSHCVYQLLERGYEVRTTVRSTEKKIELIEDFSERSGLSFPKLNLQVYVADLSSDDGWEEAIDGCDYVLHVASPVPKSATKDPDDLIQPAKKGVLRVLKLSQKKKVKRVVLTSSSASVAFAKGSNDKLLDENDWTECLKGLNAYILSKTIAEKSAWEFINGDQNQNSEQPLELAVMNPLAIFGPSIIKDKKVNSGTFNFLQVLTDGTLKRGCPKITLSVIDVRDVAKYHLEAMTEPAAKSQRFILCTRSNCLSLMGIADILRFRIPKKYSDNLPHSEIPSFIINFCAMFLPILREVRDYLPKKYLLAEKAYRTFKWELRPTEDAIIAGADSFFRSMDAE